jgi:hypothetical protein
MARETRVVGFEVMANVLLSCGLVCNPRYIVTWNGGERLVLAFVLLAMRSNGFFRRNILCLGSLIVCSVVLGSHLLMQWVILIFALNSLSRVETATAAQHKPDAKRSDSGEPATASYSCAGNEFVFPLLLPVFEATIFAPAAFGQAAASSSSCSSSSTTAVTAKRRKPVPLPAAPTRRRVAR